MSKRAGSKRRGGKPPGSSKSGSKPGGQSARSGSKGPRPGGKGPGGGGGGGHRGGPHRGGPDRSGSHRGPDTRGPAERGRERERDRPREREYGHEHGHERDGAAADRGFLKDARAKTRTSLDAWLAQSAALRAAPRTASDALALDPWQQQVLDTLVAGDSVIVDAPTTAGKTRAVEAFFRANIGDPLFRAVYTTPVKSLSNDKLREFRAMFGAENVGIATGDIKENLGAPIVVATLESYRNSLLGTEPDLGRTLAVFDEYHYLQDEGRGSAWEEALILTPRRCQVLLLSASVANAEEFCDWLESLGEGRKCVLVRTEKRPVPLVHLVHHAGEWLHVDALPSGVLRQLDRQRLEIPIRQEALVDKLVSLIELELVPCILYAGRRLACETLANALCRALPPLPEADNARIGESLQASQQEFGGLQFINPKLRHMLQVYGVGFHHSGLAAPARMAIEQLVKNGLLRFCTATMGLSLGINFSVRSALISDYQRPGEAGFTDYAPSEVLQMLGRAGRRGRDAVGFSLWPNLEAFSRLGGARRDNVRSRLRNDPTTFLGLVGRGFGLRAIENFYSKSFRRFQDKHVDLSLITKSRLGKKLEGLELPCASPAAEFARFTIDDPSALCRACPHRADCHPVLQAKSAGSLTALHLHLHRIGALDRDESLTSYGSVARYFPQAGGLVLARLITDRKIGEGNLHQAAELCGALSLARFKEPGGDARYRLPFNATEIEEMLEEHYPYELFEEIYDPPFARRNYPVIREFNPAAGQIVREWIQGRPWKELIAMVCTEQYGTGDVMSLLYRIGTYLQSTIQADLPDLKPMAKTLREVILREPLAFALSV
jgi:hypothetical protein